MKHNWEITPQTEDERDALNAVEYALAQAAEQGANKAECAADQGNGFSASVRKGEVETVEHNRDKSLSIVVYFDHNSGSASTTDFSQSAITKTVDSACSIARHTEADPYNGLADRDLLATEFPDLKLDHSWDLDLERACELAKECEQAAFDIDKRITNSEGASVSSHRGISVYANSNAFRGIAHGSSHSIGCSMIAGSGDNMQRDYWYDSARDPRKLNTPHNIGKEAARRTIRRLDAGRIKTGEYDVIYEASVASSLLSHFVSAISGANLYRKASFLLDHLGKQIFPEFIRIHEQPHLLSASGSCVYDNEGVATKDRNIVEDGVLQAYVLSSYSARKLGLETTANAGGVHNLTIDHGEQNLTELLQGMDKGLLVTELIGFGVNTVTGDYSRGAFGFWVENGEIQYPVQEFTVAGNLKQFFSRVLAIGNDVDERKNIRTGSILIDKLSVAGEV